MGVRERFERYVSRLVVEGSGGVRAAPDMFTGGGFNVVPTLQFRSRKEHTSAPDLIRHNPLLFSPTFRLALRMGGFPIKVYSIDTANGERRERWDHPGYQLLRTPLQQGPLTRNLLISGTVLNMLAHNKMGWLKVRPQAAFVEDATGRRYVQSGGPPLELVPIPGGILHPKRSPGRIIESYEVRAPGAQPFTIAFQDVCYFRLMPDFDDWADGMGPISPLGGIGDVGASALEAMDDLFTEGLLQRVWVNLNGKTLDDRRAARLEGKMTAIRQDRLSIPVMEDGATLETLGQGPNDELLYRAVEAASKVAGMAFGFPPDGDQRLFYAEVVQPVADALEQELERSLFTEWPRDPAFPEFQFREVLRGTPGERITSNRDAILSGQLTINEARRRENLPPIPGGDIALIPLNAVPVTEAPVSGVPREKDSAGGQGGDEGKDTTVSAVPPKAAMARARRANRFDAIRKAAWQRLRERLVESQAQSLQRHLRGLLRREGQSIRKLLGDYPGRAGSRVEAGLPSLDEMLATARVTDGEVARWLERHMAQAGDRLYAEGADLVNLEAQELEDRLMGVYHQRADAVATRFGSMRRDDLAGLFQRAVEEGLRPRDFGELVGERYSQFATYLTDGIARTEVAWAAEQAALQAWSDAGVSQVEWVFGGGPCSTGVCEGNVGVHRLGEAQANVGFSFEDADAPPVHPNCTCLVVPYVA